MHEGEVRPVDMPPIRTVERQTLVERVYNLLLQNICSGSLAPGQKLVIDNLAKQMNVSITPVREALRRLQHEGLITEVPYSGVHVSRLAIDEIFELFSIRGVLEGYALRRITEVLTAEHLDRVKVELAVLEEISESGDTSRFRKQNIRFHDTLLDANANGPLREMIEQLYRKTERYRAAGAVLTVGYIRAAQVQHREIVRLLEAGHAADVERLTREHALTFARYLSRYLRGEQP
jgi:DNA-binding GntR family transcriptional regulator